MGATNLDMWTDSNTRQRDVLCNEANGVVSVMEYAVANEFMSQRFTSEYILNSGHAEHSFAEWQPISVGYAWNDVMHTGNLSMAEQFYDLLCNYTLLHLIDPEVGLVNVAKLPTPEIDWPANMRDGFDFSAYNTVINAYTVRAAQQMADMAGWLNRPQDVSTFRNYAESVARALNSHNFNGTVYCDGRCADTNHTSWNANLFPLAFGLVEKDKRQGVFAYVRDRTAGPKEESALHEQSTGPTGHVPKPQDGMPGNVYSSWFALEGLFKFGDDQGKAAVDLLLSNRTDSWLSMLHQGATTTMEAWTAGEKPNLTWSHPWGAAPAFAILVYLLGWQ